MRAIDSLEMWFPVLWNNIFERFKKVSISLQFVNIELGTTIEMYQTLIRYLDDKNE